MRPTIPGGPGRVTHRWPLLPTVVLAVALVAVGSAAAERVRTTGSTKVYRRTGEQSEVVTRIKKGTTLQVVAVAGRWLKVRANGRTGWITRGSVESLDPTLPRNTRRRPFVDGRSLDRDDTGDAPDDRIGADAVGGGGDGRDGGSAGADDDDDDDAADDDDDRDDDDAPPARAPDRRPVRGPARPPAPAPVPDADDDDDDDSEDVRAHDRDGADDEDDDAEAPPTLTVRVARAPLYPHPSRDDRPVRTLRAGDQVVVLEAHRSGTWLRVEVADDDATAGYIARDAVGRPGGRSPRTLAASAGLGFASIGGTFHSDGAMLASGPPPDYPFGSSAIALAVGAEAHLPLSGRIVLGGSARYLGCRATPGIGFAGTNIGFTTHDVDLRALAGYQLRGPRALTAWARLGLHFGRFGIADLANPAKLPVETVLGPVVGAAVELAHVTPKLGAEIVVDVMPTASRAQTKNQGDGQVAATRALWLQLAATYAWRPRWRIEGGYQLGYAGTRWVGPSDRHQGATGATRTDLAHVVQVGVTRPF